MEEKSFLDQAVRPTEPLMRQALGQTYALYEKLMGQIAGFSADWTFTKSGGWTLKVHDKKKALLYVIPLKDEFKIGMAIREAEREAFLKDVDLTAFHIDLESAKKYVEGYALHFKIFSASEYETFAVLLNKLIVIRKA